MRLAILGTRGVPARYGGFETFAEEIGAGLSARDFDVTVFCVRERGMAQPLEYRGMRLEYVSSPGLGSLTTIVFDLLCLWRARRSYDVVYMLGYGASAFCFIPRLWGARVWINMDGIEWARSKWSWSAKAYLRLMEAAAMWTPNRIIADAEAIRAYLERRYRKMPKCSVIPYGSKVVEGAAVKLLEEWDLAPNAYCIVVCRLEPENHVLDILRGYVASRFGYPLVIVGDYQAETSYVQQLRALEDSRLKFIGPVYDQKKLRALRYYAIAYFHGHSVGGTNPSLLEAMGCGNVVIAHDNVFNREVAGDAAMYFKTMDDIPSLVHQLQSDRKASSFRQVMARRRIAEIYSWDRIVKVYETLLQE